LNHPDLSLPPPAVLVVDDDPAVLRQMAWLFKPDYPVLTAETTALAIDLFLRERPTVAVLDLGLGQDSGKDGVDLLRFFSEADPAFHGIILSGDITRPRALEAVRLGAYDLLDKTVDPEELRRVVARAYNRALLSRKTRAVPEVVPESAPESLGIVTKNDKICEMLRILRKIAATDVSVLITGESGTGKELFARACHQASPRKDGPFVAINCGAIPENLMESELFGHEKGAFTGATESRGGKFEAADRGTLFLDEVAELPVDLQVKLLRVLQDKIVERVGARTGKKLDIRIIAATNQPLPEMMAKGRFREDLFYRLSVMSFILPPLRERGEDVTLLARYFLERFRTEYQKTQVVDFSSECLRLIESYDWPGNIREMENRIRRAVIISTDRFVTPADLDVTPAARDSSEDPSAFLPLLTPGRNLTGAREEAEKRMLTEAFEKAKGNISHVARLIGTSRPTVHALIKKHGLNPREFKD
jgi:two-component system NtrC family response regulator